MAFAHVRHVLLQDLDPADGACTLILARLTRTRATATPADVHHLMQAALDSGEVPIGPIEYSRDIVDYTLDPHRPLAALTATGPSGVTLRLALALGDDGTIGIGGSRYGHLPHEHTPRDPGAVFLPDVEAALAEMAVYTRLRAAHLAYTGPLSGALEIHSDRPIRPVVITPATGRATLRGPLTGFDPIPFDYRLDDPPHHVAHAGYTVARQVALRFGAPEPQFLTAPGA